MLWCRLQNYIDDNVKPIVKFMAAAERHEVLFSHHLTSGSNEDKVGDPKCKPEPEERKWLETS